jgi:hypothetical protein
MSGNLKVLSNRPAATAATAQQTLLENLPCSKKKNFIQTNN